MDGETAGNKIVVCIEEYPPREVDVEGNGNTKIKKDQQIYELKSTNNDEPKEKNDYNDNNGGRGLEDIF